MMKGNATGKGMDIKGKSAKRGRLSGLVPFIQIHDEEHRHKGKLGLSKDGRVIVYFKSKKVLKIYSKTRVIKIYHGPHVGLRH